MNRRHAIVLLGAALLFAREVSAQPSAASLQAAKAAGQIGERPDGFVGLVVALAPASVQSLVQQVNAQRLARYNEIARGNGTPVDQVRALAGKTLIERTPAGQYVMDGSGRWVRK